MHVYVCDQLNTKVYPETCEAGAWMDVQEFLQLADPPYPLPPVFPELSTADASQIGMAIAMCWVIGWAWREIRRSVNSPEKGE